MAVPLKSQPPMSLLPSALPQAAGSLSAQNSPPILPQNNPQLWPGPGRVNTPLSSFPGGCSLLSPSKPPLPGLSPWGPQGAAPCCGPRGQLLASWEAGYPVFSHKGFGRQSPTLGGLRAAPLVSRGLWRPNPQNLHLQGPGCPGPGSPPPHESQVPLPSPWGHSLVPWPVRDPGDGAPAPAASDQKPYPLTSPIDSEVLALRSLLAQDPGVQGSILSSPRTLGSGSLLCLDSETQVPSLPSAQKPGVQAHSPLLPEAAPFCLKPHQSQHPGQPPPPHQLQPPHSPDSGAVHSTV